MSQATWQAGVVEVEVSHTAMPCDVGAGQALHDAPHEAVLVLDTHGPVPAGQRWKPGLHWVPQVFAVQTAWAFVSEGAGQVMHDAEVPHCTMLSLGKQPLAAGHMCVPAPHIAPHIALTQALPAGHASQSTPSIVPHAFDELLPTHWPLHRWKPVSQC